MKAEVTSSKKNLLKLKFKDMDQGLINMIKDQLWKDKATEAAGFRITHPQVGHLEFTLKTKGKDAKKVWNSAIDILSKQTDEFKKLIK